jgi:NDP-sugar pyrophosphorylase family protein/lipopolysaccharide/colanic/teichoic acid biosynthesis glycosyltransferase
LKILLLATGEEQKLNPLVLGPMLPVLNRPVMAYTIEMVARQGFKQIDVALHQNPSEVEAYFSSGRRWGLELNYHLQREAWGDGGAIRWAYPQSDQTVLLLPTSILIDLDIMAAYRFHQERQSGLTVVATNADLSKDNRLSVTRTGGLLAQGDGDLRSTGVFILEPDVIARIPDCRPVDLLCNVIPDLLMAGHPAYAFEHFGFCNILDDFAAYRSAQFDLLRYMTKSPEGNPLDLNYIRPEGKEISRGIWVGHTASIHPDVQMTPTIYVNDRCQIQKDVIIGPDVILGSNVIIDRGATLAQSLVLDNTYIGRLVDIKDKIVCKTMVIDIPSGEYINIPDAFLLGEVGAENVEGQFRRIAELIFMTALLISLIPLFLILCGLALLGGLPVFTHVTCLHEDPSNAHKLPVSGKQRFNLIRFATSRANGKHSTIKSVLEKLELYRLPELINVLKGDIALVGVKPLSAAQVDSLQYEWQMTRFSIPSGFTGLWYVNSHEEMLLEETLVTDAYYAALRNWRTDIQILLQTPDAWFRKIVHAQKPQIVEPGVESG